MVQVTIGSLTPSTPPDNGWIVSYRIKDSGSAFIPAVGSPFHALPIVFNTTDAAGTLYEAKVVSDCGYMTSTEFLLVDACRCTGSGFTPNERGDGCVKLATTPATIVHSDYCLATSQNRAYSNYGARIYTSGFSLDTLHLDPGVPDSKIYGSMTTNPQWCNPASSVTAGPMNREGVWIDSDCSGTLDSLEAGQETTIAAQFNNAGASRLIFIGIAGDNQFSLKVNGTLIIDTGTITDSKNFKFWHIVPVTIINGVNYINAVSTGDGSINDSIAMVVYDNTAGQIKAATSDSQLNILFKSSTLRGKPYNVATCPDNFSLDVSGGTTGYICKQAQTKVCNSAT